MKRKSLRGEESAVGRSASQVFSLGQRAPKQKQKKEESKEEQPACRAAAAAQMDFHESLVERAERSRELRPAGGIGSRWVPSPGVSDRSPKGRGGARCMQPTARLCSAQDEAGKPNWVHVCKTSMEKPNT